MATQVFHSTVIVATRSTKAAPQQTNISIPSRVVVGIRVRVPAGCRGQVGFQLTSNGAQVIPETAGEWIVEDDQVLTYELTGLHTSGQWELTAYNTGQYPHTIQVALTTDYTDTTTVAGMTPIIDPAALSAP